MNATVMLVETLLGHESDMSDPVERREVQIANTLRAALTNFGERCPELFNPPQAGEAPTIEDALRLCDELKELHGQ